MAIRNSAPVSWQPKGLTDSADGTNAFPGAMKSLVNVIPDNSTAMVWVPRPAATRLANFTGANAPADPTTLSALLVVGDIAYGMVPSSLSAGKDQPYAYDLANSAFLPIAGITSANVPASPPASGDWTPPIMAQVAGRIIVTHPGFPGTNLLSHTSTGNTHSSTLIDGNPNINGVLTGMTISGTGIPASTLIVTATAIQVNAVGDSHTNTTLDNLTNTLNVVVGQLVFGPNIPAGTTVTVVVSATEVTMSAAATSTLAGQIYVFGGATITMSKSATASANGVTLTIAGTPEYFGWLDVSAFSEVTPGNTLSGSIIIRGNPVILGVQPGMTISGTGVPAATTVVGAAEFVRTTSCFTVTGSELVQNVNNTQGIAKGQRVEGFGIDVDTFVVSVDFGSRVSLNKQVLTGATTDLTFTGATITMSAAATATANDINLTIAGGTAAAPLWGAGNTDRFALPSIPLGVAQFNGRAYYALGSDGLVFSDSGWPCRVSNSAAVQALTTQDGLAVTALGQLLLTAPLTGGIVQAIIAFQGATRMQQITGDPATGNLTMNVMPVATGTLAPLSIVPTERGLAFMSPLGLRFVKFDGTVSEPIGADGMGITAPFQFAAAPSQICAAANVGILRISVQNNLLDGVPYQEYWFDLKRGIWHGPHTFPARLIQPWRSSFLTAPRAATRSLWQSDAYATSSSTYTENGWSMSWIMETVLLPDNANVAMNAMVEVNLACAASSGNLITVAALDESGAMLDTISITTSANHENLRQRALNWTQPIIFKQMSVRISGPSDFSMRIGNLYMRHEVLGYNLDDEAGYDFWLLSSRLDYPILMADDDTHLVPG